MTNEQTLILIQALRDQLMAAILKANALMPEGIERYEAWKHIEPTHLWCTRKINPDHYQRVEGRVKSLEPLYDLLDSYDSHIDALQTSVEKRESKSA